MDELNQPQPLDEPEKKFAQNIYWGYAVISLLAFVATLFLLYDAQPLAALLTALICANFIYLSIKQPSKKNTEEVAESQKFN